MPLPEAYVNNTPKIGQYCGNCEYYINNHCIKFNEQVASYGWCEAWESINEEQQMDTES